MSSTGKKKNRRKPRRARHTLGPGTIVGENLLDKFEQLSVDDEVGLDEVWTVIGPKPSQTQTPSNASDFPVSSIPGISGATNPPVLIDARVMRRNGWNSADFMYIESGSGDVCDVCVLWPSETVPPGHLRLQPATLKAFGTGNQVKMSIIKSPVPHIERIVLKTPQTFSCASDDLPLIEASLRGRVVCNSNMNVSVPFYGKSTRFSVDSMAISVSAASSTGTCTGGMGFGVISGDTEVRLEAETATGSDGNSGGNNGDAKNESTYSSAYIGGLDTQINDVKKMVESALVNPGRLTQFGIRPPRGVLLFGASGVGKTLLARTIAAESECRVYNLSNTYSVGSNINSNSKNDNTNTRHTSPESYIRNIFTEASRNAPSIVVIDDVEVIAPARENAPSEEERRVVSTLLSILDGSMDQLSRVFVIATSSKPHGMDPALRRPGRLDRELEITVPSSTQRTQIIKCILQQYNLTLENDDEIALTLIASKCHGFVGADLKSLVEEAMMVSLKRQVANVHAHFHSPSSVSGPLVLEDMLDALKRVKPSAMREVFLDVPHVLWSDIGGQDLVKQKLKEAVEWPLKHADAFKRMGIQPPRGLLLYGPPGCSKTMMAKALATESGLNFVAVKGPELFSKWVGESERAVKRLFQRARAVAPSIIFLDEIDALAVMRGSNTGSSGVSDRVLSQLLMEMDGVEGLDGVVVVGATNRPDMIDKALMRPGRFDHIMYVGLPDSDARLQIFTNQLCKIPHSDDVTPQFLCGATDGYSGAECVALCREAALLALHTNANVDKVSLACFQSALHTVTARTSSSMLRFFDKFKAQHAGAEL